MGCAPAHRCTGCMGCPLLITIAYCTLSAASARSADDNFLGGARDLVYDSDRQLVLVAAPALAAAPKLDGWYCTLLVRHIGKPVLPSPAWYNDPQGQATGADGRGDSAWHPVDGSAASKSESLPKHAFTVGRTGR